MKKNGLKQQKNKSDEKVLEELSDIVEESAKGVEYRSSSIGTNLGDLLRNLQEKGSRHAG